MDKIEIITGLYRERNSKRCPLYTTEIKSELFGGTHYTLEALVKNLIKIPEISVHRGTNAKEREKVAKRFKITIEKL